MPTEDVNFAKWQQYAKQVLGRDFFDDFFSQGSRAVEPRHNIYRNSSEIIVLVELPFINKLSDVKLNVREEELYVKGEINLGYDHLDKVEEQIYEGTFEKRIALPDSVNTKKANAHYVRGILKVQLFPKRRGDEATIQIKES